MAPTTPSPTPNHVKPSGVLTACPLPGGKGQSTPCHCPHFLQQEPPLSFQWSKLPTFWTGSGEGEGELERLHVKRITQLCLNAPVGHWVKTNLSDSPCAHCKWAEKNRHSQTSHRILVRIHGNSMSKVPGIQSGTK